MAPMEPAKNYGGLDCRVVDGLGGADPEAAVILMHGFGAPGTDLVPIGQELIGMSEALAKTTRFYFPAAPLDLSMIGMPGARAWWHLDVETLYQRIATGEVLDPKSREEPPEGIGEVRARVLALVEEVREETGLEMSRIVLGGFSQGSMLACDVALRLAESPAGMALWSSMPICLLEWRKLVAQRAGTPVFLSHGTIDPLLPFPLAEEMKTLLGGAGLDVTFVPFAGPHAIPYEVYDAFVPWAEGLLTARDSSSS